MIQWFACRRNWRRAGLALIRAVRALAQESRDSSRFEKTYKTARGAKKRFRHATEQLTLAEAAMETWRGDALSKLSDPPLQPTAGQVKRVAMRGGAERIEILARRLELADKADLAWVRAERVQMRARRSVFAHFGWTGLSGRWFVWERPG
jgi:hypothetical protein